MNKMTAVIALAISLILTACVATEDSSDQTKINSVTLSGSAPSVNGVVPLNANLDEGAFTISWNVSSSDPYNVRLYISNDMTRSDNDTRFFSQNCGSSSSIYNCGKTANFDCSFNTENQIVCNEGFGNSGANLSSFLSSLPQQAYLIVYACNGLFDSCEEEAIKVEFQ